MIFTLTYRGELKANRGPADKHRIRRHFHPQLRELWNQRPLLNFQDFLQPRDAEELSVLRRVGGVTFAPLVTEGLSLLAELDILFLRPEPPGHIVTTGGDIDNRIKTLLDALSIPPQVNALPDDATPAPDEDPFFCLLESDSLVVRINVETDRLLEPVESANEVLLVIRVRTRQLGVMIKTIGLA